MNKRQPKYHARTTYLELYGADQRLRAVNQALKDLERDKQKVVEERRQIERDALYYLASRNANRAIVNLTEPPSRAQQRFLLVERTGDIVTTKAIDETRDGD